MTVTFNDGRWNMHKPADLQWLFSINQQQQKCQSLSPKNHSSTLLIESHSLVQMHILPANMSQI